MKIHKENIKSIDRIAFEFWAGIGSQTDLDDWADAQLRSGDPHPDACDLFHLSYEKAEQESARLAKEITGFVPTSEQGEAWGQEILLDFCDKLLKEELTPYDFCQLVRQFDGGFLGAREMDDEKIVYYPEWLGDLWNDCDWCDERWTLSNSPELEEGVRKFLKYWKEQHET